MDVPSIKGTGLSQVVADLLRLLEEGRVTREQLEVRLTAEDLALLDEKIHAGAWYPNACHRRMTELLRDVEGDGREAYVIQRGRRTGDRLVESGIYRQLRLADEGAEDEGELRRSVRIMLSLSGSLYSFGRWTLDEDADPGRLRILVSGAADLSEMNRLTAEGCIARIAERAVGRPVRSSSRRLDPERVEVVIELA